MIIAVPAATSGEKSFVSEHFSKCNFFYMYDTNTKEGHVYTNELKTLKNGGGRSVAKFLLDLGVNVIIAKEVGHGAKDQLGERIEIYEAISETIQNNINCYLNKELNKL